MAGHVYYGESVIANFFRGGGNAYVLDHNIRSRQVDAVGLTQCALSGWSASSLSDPFVNGRATENHGRFQLSISTVSAMQDRTGGRARTVCSPCRVRSLWLSLCLVSVRASQTSC